MSDAPAKDYGSTLNLPKTDFPMKGNLAQLEPRMLGQWATAKTFEAILAKRKGAPLYVMHDGPPYANGHLHAGHALNKILKDIVVKYRNLSGSLADFVPGWDCHGLPIEQAVEKKLRDKKIDKRTLSREEFLTKCREYAVEYIDVQREEFKRMGLLASWETPYKTLSFDYEAQEIRELAKFASAGMLYRKNKPVYWSIAEQTALAEAEVEYEMHTSPSVFVAFAAQSDLSKKWSALAGKKVQFVIWTTTPWTLPANLAICVNKEFEYVFYEVSPDRVLVIAKELLGKVLAECAPDQLKLRDVKLAEAKFDAAVLAEPRKILAYASGEDLVGLAYTHVFYERTGHIISGDHVTLEAGTGLVHTAPGHGQEDYEVGLQFGLDIYNPVKADGRYDDTVGPLLTGKKVFDANPIIVELLAEKGVLLNEKGASITHSYPHSWRSKTPLIFRATPQWFIALDDKSELRKKSLDQVDNVVKWVPAWGHERIRGMLESRPDWCISRQRTWGVPIPIAMCESCDEALIDPQVMNRVADAVEKSGADVWYSTPVEQFLAPGAKCAKCGSSKFRRETDILDVWFDSACSFAAVAAKRPNMHVPVDLYLEGSDQHRGWFHSSLLVGVGTMGKAPYKTCLTHGFVVDGNGEKMSKSVGNTVSPEDITKKYGAEIMRLWVASSDYRNDVRLSNGILDGLSDGYRKIRNTIRYALSNLFDFDPATDSVAQDKLLPLDVWASAKLDGLNDRVKKAYENYEFHQVYQSVIEFCSNELSAIFFDIQKDTLYTRKKNGLKRRSAQTVLYRIAHDLLVLLAPITSFTSEEGYAYLPGKKEVSVFLADFPKPHGISNEALVRDYDTLFSVRSGVTPHLETARRDKKIGKSLEAKVTLYTTGAMKDFLARYLDVLPELFIVSQVEMATSDEGLLPAGGDVKAGVSNATGNKCPRCWTFAAEVGKQELCDRCVEAVG